MSSTTPNLALTLYDSSGDQAVAFATFRAVWGGPATTSNFYKIDTAYGVQAAQITSLQGTRGAATVNAIFISANYYEATGVTAITSYTTGSNIILTVDTTSSGTVTLNINALGTKSVMKVDSTGTVINLTGSDLVKGRSYLFTYDGTRWLWVSANSADQIQIVGTSGNVVTIGSSNNLDGTLTQSLLLSQTTHAATAKTTLTGNDEFGIVDSAASNVLKRITWTNFQTAIGTALGAIITALTGKTTPVDADEIVISDSAASNATKKVSFTNLKAFLKTYFDALYQVVDPQLSSLIRQNSKSTAYTTVLTDGGKHILHPTADNNPRTFTIDSNANVAYSIGTAITFVNEINTVTIAITSDTMTLAGLGTTGSRTLAANGISTALKIGTTNWIISGTGLT